MPATNIRQVIGSISLGAVAAVYLSGSVGRAADAEDVAIIDLAENKEFTEKIYSFVEQYMTISRRHQADGADDKIIDHTGYQRIGIEQPDEEGGENFYLIVEGRRQLLFSKNVMGFAAYETDIPVYAIVGLSTYDVYSVFIRLGQSGQFLQLTVVRRRGGLDQVIAPTRLLFDIDGFHHLGQGDLLVYASIGPVEPVLPAPIAQLGPCPPTIWLPNGRG